MSKLNEATRYELSELLEEELPHGWQGGVVLADRWDVTQEHQMRRVIPKAEKNDFVQNCCGPHTVCDIQYATWLSATFKVRQNFTYLPGRAEKIINLGQLLQSCHKNKPGTSVFLCKDGIYRAPLHCAVILAYVSGKDVWKILDALQRNRI